MHAKNRLRKKFLTIRKKKYFEISTSFFDPLTQLIKKKNFQNKILIYLVIILHLTR